MITKKLIGLSAETITAMKFFSNPLKVYNTFLVCGQKILKTNYAGTISVDSVVTFQPDKLSPLK